MSVIGEWWMERELTYDVSWVGLKFRFETSDRNVTGKYDPSLAILL